MQPSSRVTAVIGVPTALMTSTAVLGWATSGAFAAVTAPGPAGFDDLLAVIAAGVAWAVLAWLTAGLLLCLAAATRRGDGRLDLVAQAVTPLVVRRLAALLLGLGLVGAPLALALPAQADRTTAAATQPAEPTEPPVDMPALDRWTPDLPVAPPSAASTQPAEPPALLVTRPHRRRVVSEDVVVRRGDTLWDIAARALGPNASAADIAASWPGWYAANRSTIGPDPDLILPGQRLRPPAT
jgi:nucleoid-associated protein YgaU